MHPLTVSLTELRRAFEFAVAHVVETVGDEINLAEDYFWSVPVDQIYNVEEEPTELTIGQLSESWGNVQELLENPENVTSYTLVWIADVIRSMGQSIVR
jgi:hypothetical protein